MLAHTPVSQSIAMSVGPEKICRPEVMVEKKTSKAPPRCQDESMCVAKYECPCVGGGGGRGATQVHK